jgi:hypothetical protein
VGNIWNIFVLRDAARKGKLNWRETGFVVVRGAGVCDRDAGAAALYKPSPYKPSFMPP